MRILYITRSPPLPTHIGGNQRTNLMYQALSRCGTVDLFLALDARELSPSQRREIESRFRFVGCAAPRARAERGIWRALARLHRKSACVLADLWANRIWDYVPDPDIQAAIRALTQTTKFDAVVVKSLSLAMRTGLPPAFPVILDVDDVEFEWYESQLADPYTSRLRKIVAARRLAQLAGKLPGWYARYSYVWVTKKTDISYPGLQGARVVGVPFYTADGKIPTPVPDTAAHRVILMVGSYHHRPNREGLAWFLRWVWPIVRDLRPDARVRVVGAGLTGRDQTTPHSPGVELVGVVSDVASEYAQCALTIAPIWSGAGINVKVFESYLYGRASVLTRFAYRGYEECLPQGDAVAVADTPEDFARNCVMLLDSVTRRTDMVERGRPRVLEAFSFDRFSKVVSDTLLDAGKHRGARTTCG